jgi:hypothetical protein
LTIPRRRRLKELVAVLRCQLAERRHAAIEGGVLGRRDRQLAPGLAVQVPEAAGSDSG